MKKSRDPGQWDAFLTRRTSAINPAPLHSPADLFSSRLALKLSRVNKSWIEIALKMLMVNLVYTQSFLISEKEWFAGPLLTMQAHSTGLSQSIPLQTFFNCFRSSDQTVFIYSSKLFLIFFHGIWHNYIQIFCNKDCSFLFVVFDARLVHENEFSFFGNSKHNPRVYIWSECGGVREIWKVCVHVGGCLLLIWHWMRKNIIFLKHLWASLCERTTRPSLRDRTFQSMSDFEVWSA